MAGRGLCSVHRLHRARCNVERRTGSRFSRLGSGVDLVGWLHARFERYPPAARRTCSASLADRSGSALDHFIKKVKDQGSRSAADERYAGSACMRPEAWPYWALREMHKISCSVEYKTATAAVCTPPHLGTLQELTTALKNLFGIHLSAWTRSVSVQSALRLPHLSGSPAVSPSASRSPCPGLSTRR